MPRSSRDCGRLPKSWQVVQTRRVQTPSQSAQRSPAICVPSSNIESLSVIDSRIQNVGCSGKRQNHVATIAVCVAQSMNLRSRIKHDGWAPRIGSETGKPRAPSTPGASPTCFPWLLVEGLAGVREGEFGQQARSSLDVEMDSLKTTRSAGVHRSATGEDTVHWFAVGGPHPRDGPGAIVPGSLATERASSNEVTGAVTQPVLVFMEDHFAFQVAIVVETDGSLTLPIWTLPFIQVRCPPCGVNSTSGNVRKPRTPRRSGMASFAPHRHSQYPTPTGILTYP